MKEAYDTKRAPVAAESTVPATWGMGSVKLKAAPLPPAKIRFIREEDALEPTEDKSARDDFKHTEIAEALAEALRLDPELRVIGLVGKWGSGKSKILRIARDLTPSMHFFTYDAWLHQSDAPRRAFLEDLMADAKARNFDLDQVRQDWDVLLGRKERVQIESVPSVPVWVGFITALLLLAVMASNFLPKDQKLLMEVMTNWSWSNPVHRVAGAAVVLAALPFLLTLLVSLWRSLRSLRASLGRSIGMTLRPNADGGPVDDGPSQREGGIAAVLANRVSETRTDIKTREPDPTVREFQRFLRAILSARPAKDQALTTQPRLVVVIDNLDRLPDEQLPALWSTIRGLFYGLAPTKEGALLPTVILPIDEGALLRVHDGNPELAAGFSDKSFDIVFRVPTPVHSEWRHYLETRLREAFGEEYKERPGDLKELVTLSARVLEDVPVNTRTPRALNAYVNQLATLWLQRRRQPVCPAALCFYAAFARQLTNPVEVLGNADPWYSETYPHWAADVAAIHFGTSRETALQVLLSDPLQTALIQGQEKAFDELSRVPGFSSVLRRIYDTYAQSPPNHLNRAALYLNRLFPTKDADLIAAWRGVVQGMCVHWTLSDTDALEALKIVLAQPTSAAQQRLITAFPSKVLGVSHETFATLTPRILDAVSLVDEAAAKLGLDSVPLQIPGGIEPEMAFCNAITIGDSRIKRFVSQFGPTEFAEALARMAFQNEGVRKRWDHYLAVLQSWAGTLDWVALARALERGLYATAGQIHAAEALAGLWAIDEARDTIRAITSAEPFMALVERSMPAGWAPGDARMGYDALAITFALAIVTNGYLPRGRLMAEAIKDSRTGGGDLVTETAKWLQRMVAGLTVASALSLVEVELLPNQT